MQALNFQWLNTVMENVEYTTSTVASQIAANSQILAEKLFTAIRTERKEDIEKYLCLGADPNFILLNGISSLHLASGCSRSYEFVSMILQYDGNPNVRDQEGVTPLHVATLWGKTDCVNLLVQNGADVALKDYEGKDLRWFAKENGSSSCLSLVDALLRERKHQASTPSTKRCVRNIKTATVTPRNMNQPTNQNESTYDPISIRSPLHALCDDSWIVKRRGSKNHSIENQIGKNSPTKSPEIQSGPFNPPNPKTPISHDRGVWHCYICHCSAGENSSRQRIHSNSEPNSSCCYELEHKVNSALISNCDNCTPCKLHSRKTKCKRCCEIRPSDESISSDKEDLDLHKTDKCIGTSVLDTSDHDICTTESVSCQVTMGSQHDADFDAESNNISGPCKPVSTGLHQIDKLENDSQPKTDAVNGIVSDGTETNIDSAMTEFLRGCNRFLDGSAPKGLDVSSPDHCKSFLLVSQDAMEQEKVVSSPVSTCRHLSNPTKQRETHHAVNCNNVHEEDQLNERVGPKPNHIEKKGKINTEKSSREQGMLLSTKVPLTQSEMINLYGREISYDTDTENQMSVKTTQSKAETGQSDVESFTMSESTVPIDKNSELQQDNCNSGNVVMQEWRNVSGGSSESKLIVDCSSKRELEENLKQEPNDCLKQQNPVDLFSTSISPNSLSTRLHSTALDDSINILQGFQGMSFNISGIDAKANVHLHTEEDAVSWLESRTPPGVEVCSPSDPPTLHLSSSNASSQSTIVYNWKTFWKSEPLPKLPPSNRAKTRSDSQNEHTSTKLLENLTNNEIRERLVSLGHNPGPIGACRNIYLKQLEQSTQLATGSRSEVRNEETGNHCNSSVHDEPKFSHELQSIMLGRSLPDSVVKDNEAVCSQFEQPDPTLRWREGTAKNSFTYILLDPRVTDKLPVRAENLSEVEAFKSFVGAIFYVGKGKQSRPYSHFREALQTNVMHYKLNPSAKIRHIHDIWAAGFGVISLHVFQSVIACEAYTREAAMIDAVSLSHLTNRKRGDYYGLAASWDARKKRTYGCFLVMQAMKVLLVEGERQIRPANLKTRNAVKWTGCLAPPPSAVT